MIINILVFLLVLGLLIFFHELGHFLAAKACGVYVDRFSLGMPPRIAGFRWGDTDYCIGALPIGGYVKMAGQEDAPRSEEEQLADYKHVPKEQWFDQKPVWQRYIIIVAGPAMNVVLALLLYGLVAAYGSEIPRWKVDNRIGEVLPDSAAASAPLWQFEDGAAADPDTEPDAVGWQTGDRIVSIDGEEIRNVAFDVAISAALSGDESREVVIERPKPGDGATRYASLVRPKVNEETGQRMFGVGPYNAALIETVLEGEPADEAGLQAGDVIIRANGNYVDRDSFTKMIHESAGEPLDLVVKRGDDQVELTLTPKRRGRIQDIIISPPLSPVTMVPGQEPIEVVGADPAFLERTGLEAGWQLERVAGEEATPHRVRSLADAPEGKTVEVSFTNGETRTLAAMDLLRAVTGYDPDAKPEVAMTEADEEEFKRGDIIESVNGEPASVGLLRKLQKEFAGDTLTVTVRRPAKALGLARSEKEFTTDIDVEEVGVIGVIWGQDTVFHSYPLAQVPGEAWFRAKQDIGRVVDTLALLVTGNVSPKELGGPVMIFQVTTAQFQRGWDWLFEITAFISINLAIFNLLPLPILDGGQCVLLAIEGVRRKPLDMAIVERIQQVGMLLIIFLMLFVTMNDIQRWFEGYLG